MEQGLLNVLKALGHCIHRKGQKAVACASLSRCSLFRRGRLLSIRRALMVFKLITPP